MGGRFEMRNPIKNTVTQTFITAAKELADILDQADEPRFEKMFEEVRRFFGGFTDEAQVQSSFLIDRLVERS